MHQIRKSAEGSETRFDTHLTDETIVLTAEDRAFLTKRFVKALSGRGIPIIEDPSRGSAVPSLLRQAWHPDADFIELSKGMALALADQQPGSALEGLLMVANVFLGSDEALLVAKVEHQEAMRLEPVTNAAGHQVFEIERIRDLVFGDTARIYKVGVFSRAQSAVGILSGELVDEQNGLGFAEYFLGRFLGMKLREEPAVLTERFLKGMTTAINQSSIPSDRKLDVQSALVSELASNSRTVKPLSFIRDHVPAGYGPELKTIAEGAGVPLMDFAKDATRVNSQLSRLRLDLSNGIHVIAPPEAVGGPEKPVSIEHSTAEDQDIITIRGGSLTSIRPSGGR